MIDLRTALTDGNTGSPKCSPSTPGFTPPTILVPHAKDSLTLAVALVTGQPLNLVLSGEIEFVLPVCLQPGVSPLCMYITLHPILRKGKDTDVTCKPLEQHFGVSPDLQIMESICIAMISQGYGKSTHPLQRGLQNWCLRHPLWKRLKCRHLETLADGQHPGQSIGKYQDTRNGILSFSSPRMVYSFEIYRDHLKN